MKKRVLCVACCLLLLLGLTACGAAEPEEPAGIMNPTRQLLSALEKLKPHAVETEAGTSGDTSYCIVIDDGQGMKGFVSEYCTTYSAVLSAVMSASMNSARSCYTAGDIAGDARRGAAASDDFFLSAHTKEFFREDSNSIADVVDGIADFYSENPGSVCIFISDLMMPAEDICLRTAETIQKTFLEPDDTTVGIIGVLGDFSGTVDNLPINSLTGKARSISAYMVADKDENEIFRHPIYILFMGNDACVLKSMEKALSDLENSGMLDESNPVYAAYYSEYGVRQRENDDISISFHTGIQAYDAADYDIGYLVRGLPNDDDEILYPASTNLSEEDIELLESVPVLKIYTDVRGENENNVEVKCTLPYTLTDSSNGGEAAYYKHGLLAAADEIEFAAADYSVEPVVSMLNYEEKDGATKTSEWVEADQSIIRCESKQINTKTGSVDIVFSLNTDMLSEDVPLLFSVDVRTWISPQWDEIAALYQTSWPSAWTLNLKEFTKEYIREESGTSARFTSATTAKTPFLSSLIASGIADKQTQIALDAIEEGTYACVQTTVFGIVVRDIPAIYVPSGNWKEDEDFNGWAFSREDALSLKHPESTGEQQ